VTIAHQFATAFAAFQPGLLGLGSPLPKVAKPPLAAPAQPRRGLRRGDAANYVGVSQSKFDQLIVAGQMPRPVKMGACSVGT
jgi:hypothetical protein